MSGDPLELAIKQVRENSPEEFSKDQPVTEYEMEDTTAAPGHSSTPGLLY